jgi:hypothetical protein
MKGVQMSTVIKNNRYLSFLLILVFASIISLLLSCERDETITYQTPPGGCDTVNVSFSKTLQGIFIRCTNCHGTSGGVTLTDYNNVKSSVDNGKLAHGVSPSGSMYSLLSPCESQQILAWINQGAKNN